MAYLYLKQSLVPSPAVKFKFHPPQFVITHKKYIAGGFFLIGVFFFLSVIFPIVQYQLEYAVKFNQIISPLSSKYYNQNSSILGDVSTDYTQLSNWFTPESAIATNTDNNLSQSEVSSYHLSIPVLKIKDALVEIGGKDLKKSLIQYPQTALPGQAGNTVVFGHSVLPQFFNPSSYMTILSTLYRLKIGDEIFVDYDNIKYKYLVEEMFEVQPTDLSILEQRFDGRFFTLVTCSPPGTYLRRLVIKAKIVEI